jgi:hypothetical protein
MTPLTARHLNITWRIAMCHVHVRNILRMHISDSDLIPRQNVLVSIWIAAQDARVIPYRAL